MVQSHEPLLYVRSRAAFLGATNQYTNCSCVYLVEKVLLLLVRVCVVDKGDLFFGDAALYELVFQIVVGVEVPAVFVIGICFLRRGQIAEYKLRAFDFRRVLPLLKHVLRTVIELAVVLVRHHRIDTSRIEGEFLSVARDFEHIVDMRIYTAAVYPVGALGNLFGKFDNRIRRLYRYDFPLRFRHFEFYVRFHVRKRVVQR